MRSCWTDPIREVAEQTQVRFHEIILKKKLIMKTLKIDYMETISALPTMLKIFEIRIFKNLLGEKYYFHYAFLHKKKYRVFTKKYLKMGENEMRR